MKPIDGLRRRSASESSRRGGDRELRVRVDICLYNVHATPDFERAVSKSKRRPANPTR
jgi:hypothetical protein